MARTPESNQAFFREVDDEVRREKMTEAAQRYGIIVAVAVLAALIAFGGYLWWQHHREVEAGDRGEQFTAAMSSLSSGNTADARRKLDAIVASGAKGYVPLAQILQADMSIQAGKPQDAAATFMKVANDTAVAQPVRDLALVRGTAIGFDTLAPAEVIARMKPLAVPGKPWFGSAGEMTAIAELKLGQTRQAGALLAAIATDRAVPASLRERSTQLAGDLGIDVVQPSDSPRP